MQATLVAPLKGKMFKGLCLCYAVIATTFLSVGISSYWTFGNEAMGTVLTNFMSQNSLPSWLIIITNAFCLTQVSAVAGVRPYLLHSSFLHSFSFWISILCDLIDYLTYHNLISILYRVDHQIYIFLKKDLISIFKKF